MWRSASDRARAGVLLVLLGACGGDDAAPVVALCGRGDRDLLADRVASLEVRFLDAAGGALGDPVAVDARDGHVGRDIPEGAASARVTGFDDAGDPVASGEGEVDAGGGCVCVALDGQARAACGGVACALVDDTCRFTDADGEPLTSQTLRFGEGADDDIGGVTTDTFLQEDEPTTPHDQAELEAGPTPTRDALIAFDLTALPATAVVESARLVLHVCADASCASSHAFAVLEVLEPWTEAATWDERAPGSAWSAPGCGAASCAADPVGSLIAPDVAGETEVVDLDAATVAGWIAAADDNHGVALVPTGDTGTAAHLDASEGAVPPALEITYTLP